jgi:hypothetical protein
MYQFGNSQSLMNQVDCRMPRQLVLQEQYALNGNTTQRKNEAFRDGSGGGVKLQTDNFSLDCWRNLFSKERLCL